MAAYDREKAVAYAVRYSLKGNPAYRTFDGSGGDCTNFISQCLHAGGMPMERGSRFPWWYARNAWSPSWSVAHALYWCLKNRSKHGTPGLQGFETFQIEDLQPGDLIQYERGGRIYHTAMITQISLDVYGQPLLLITQHTYNAVNIPWIKPAAEKSHFMQIRFQP